MQGFVKVQFALPCPVDHGAEVSAWGCDLFGIAQSFFSDDDKTSGGQEFSLPFDGILISGRTEADQDPQVIRGLTQS